MQNNTFFKTFMTVSFLALPAVGQEAELNEVLETEPVLVNENQEVQDFQATDLDVLTELDDLGLADKKPVDFSPRSSLGDLELTAIPGINETTLTGPQPMGQSVSIHDAPSEQLLGRLTTDVFQEMAELERDNAFLALQLKKQEATNALENARAQYRKDRLDEIAKREELVRTRIQWWQEAEKVRRESEKNRMESEALQNQKAQNEALRKQLEQAQAEAEANKNATGEPTEVAPMPEEDVAPIVQHDQYSLLNVKGTRGHLVAKVKNLTTNIISTVHIGDNLSGEVVTGITPDSVVILREGSEYVIKFITEE